MKNETIACLFNLKEFKNITANAIQDKNQLQLSFLNVLLAWGYFSEKKNMHEKLLICGLRIIASFFYPSVVLFLLEKHI